VSLADRLLVLAAVIVCATLMWPPPEPWRGCCYGAAGSLVASALVVHLLTRRRR
jgi:hypothetical protein